MFSHGRLITARLLMTPVAVRDLPYLVALKGNPLTFGQMLGGVRSAEVTARELTQDICDWGQHGYGMWSVRGRDGNIFLGTVGLMHRPDGLGVALRFSLWPKAQGNGLAREAASAALFFAHDQARLRRVVGIAREENFGSRIVLGSIGMIEIGRFSRDGTLLLVYQSVRQQTQA